MPAYELGILAANRANVPSHLKQAYASGFAGALEKRAQVSKPDVATALDVLKGPAGSAAFGAINTGVATVPIGALAGLIRGLLVSKDDEKETRRKRVLRNILGGAGVGAGVAAGAGFGHMVGEDEWKDWR